jgi:predicted NUDIX family NTP pyrophosphohydrolase
MGGRLHVVPDGPEWAVRREGAGRASSTHETQGAAINAAARTARTEKGEVVVHGRDGRIRDADSYGRDPCPPRDKRH